MVRLYPEGYLKFLDNVKRGDLGAVSSYIKTSEYGRVVHSSSSRQHYQPHPLRIAVSEGNMEMVIFLLENANITLDDFTNAVSLSPRPSIEILMFFRLFEVNYPEIHKKMLENAILSKRRWSFFGGMNSESLMMNALLNGDFQMVRLLLDLGAPVEIEGDSNPGGSGRDTFLMTVVERGDYKMAKLFLDRGADVNLSSGNFYGGGRSYQTPLLISTSSKPNPRIEKLLRDRGAVEQIMMRDQQGFTISTPKSHFREETRDKNGATELISAVMDNNLALAKTLLDNGSNLELKDNDGLSSVAHAVMNSNNTMLEFLIDYGANLEWRGKEEESLMMLAISQNNVNGVKILIKNYCNPNHKMKTEREETAIMIAILNDNIEIVDLLLKNKTYRVKLESENPIIVFAASEGKIKTVEYLLDNDFDVNTTNEKGVTSLMVAAGNNDFPMVKLLLDRGADIEQQDKQGRTAIIWSSYLRSDLMMGYLIERGANDEHTDFEGGSAYLHPDPPRRKLF